MRIATLFSGIGAPEQAAKRVWADHKIVFACEIDKFARQSYLANYDIKEGHFHKDVKELDGTKYRGKVDLLIWGFPCQDYSIAGKRAGLKGQRGTLFYEGARITKEVQPRYFVAENVKGLLSTNNGKDFETIMRILREDVGYHCTWAVLNTKDYGVPQNRERVFIVGFKDYNEYIRFEFPKPIKLEKRLKDVLEDEVDEKYYINNERYIQFITDETRIKKRYVQHNGEVAICQKAGQYANWNGDFIVEQKIEIRGSTQKNAGVMHDCCTALTSAMGMGGGQVPIVNMIRKLTPRECLRLQDFPDDFKIVVSDTQAYKQAGNSMSVNVVEAIFREIDKTRKGKTKTLF